MDIIEISNNLEKHNITGYILEALPKWFGIPESGEEYSTKDYLPLYHKNDFILK